LAPLKFDHLRHLGVAGRIGLGFGFVMLILLFQSTMGFLAASKSRQTMQVDIAAARSQYELALDLRTHVLLSDLERRGSGGPPRSDGAVTLHSQMGSNDEAVIKALALLMREALPAEESATIKELERLTVALQQSFKQPQVSSLSDDVRNRLAEVLERRRQLAGRLTDLRRERLEEIMQSVSAVADESRKGTVVTAAIALAFSALAGWLLARAIVKPIDEAVAVAQKVAEGNLAIRMKSDARNEFGRLHRSLQAMADQVREAVEEIQRAAESVLVASREIAAGNSDLSDRTERQAAQLQVAASSMAQLAHTLSLNTQSAQSAADLAQDATGRSQEGARSTERVLEAMTRIADSSKSMAEIVVTIEGIVSRTNILAINASVEAAHAGEHGSGFAVVAEEVRALARRAGEAAREIKALIERNMSNVESGTRQAHDMASVMASMTITNKHVSEEVSEIALLAKEQSTGVLRLNGIVSQLDQGLQQNSALVEESAAAAHTLKDQAQMLSSLARKFRVS